MNKSLSLVTFWLSFVETSFMFRVNIWSWHHIYRHILPNVLRRDHWRLEMLDSMGAFLWDDPDQEITWIMVDQMNRWILVRSRFIGSFDLPWSEWSRITDPDPDHPKGTSPSSIIVFQSTVVRQQHLNCLRIRFSALCVGKFLPFWLSALFPWTNFDTKLL